MARWQVLRPHIEDGVPVSRLAVQCGVAARTLQQWAARYRADGLAGLARSDRADRGAWRFPRRADHRRLRPRLRDLRARERAPVVELTIRPGRDYPILPCHEEAGTAGSRSATADSTAG